MAIKLTTVAYVIQMSKNKKLHKEKNRQLEQRTDKEK